MTDESVLAERLERLRLKLLDLTTNNRMLSFRHPKATCLRVVDELPDQLFGTLLTGAGFTFEPVSEPTPKELEDYWANSGAVPRAKETRILEKPDAAVWARRLGLNVNYDLPVEVDDFDRPKKHADNRIQTLHYGDELDARLRKIRSAARTAIEESGANMLYFAFAFLEWRDQQTSKSHQAPLILMPVDLQREAGRAGQYRTKVRWTGDELQPNLSLVKKLQEFNVALPEIEEDETLEHYLTRVARSIEAKPDWLIRRYVTLGLFEFGKILLYLDLDPARWPQSSPLGKNRIVERILVGSDDSEEPSGPISEPNNSSEAIIKRDLSLEVVDRADSSQCEALDVALNGRDLVIEGPPGTGKSQTITNLIAASLARGKTVLFVAEKLAALEVVRRRLRELGLGDFCLELHSHKTRKLEVLEDLLQRIKLSSTLKSPAEYESALSRLRSKRSELTEYVETIGARVGLLYDLTVSETLMQAGRARRRLGPLVRTFDGILLPGDLTTLTWSDVAEAKSRIKRLVQAISDLGVEGPVSEHPWAGVSSIAIFPHDEDSVAIHASNWAKATDELADLEEEPWLEIQIEDIAYADVNLTKIDPLRRVAADAEKIAEQIEKHLNISLPRAAVAAGQLLAIVEFAESHPPHPSPAGIRNYCVRPGSARWLKDRLARIQKVEVEKRRLETVFKQSAFDCAIDDLEEWAAALSQRNPLARLGGRWRAAAKQWTAICRPAALRLSATSRLENLNALRSLLTEVNALINDKEAKQNLPGLGSDLGADLSPLLSYAQWADGVHSGVPAELGAKLFASSPETLAEIGRVPGKAALLELAKLVELRQPAESFWASIVQFFVPNNLRYLAATAASERDWALLIEKARALAGAAQRSLQVEKEFCSKTDLNREMWFGSSRTPIPSAIASRARRAVSNRETLGAWLDFDRIFRGCKGGIEEPLLQLCINGAIPLGYLSTAFDFILYDGLARYAFREKPNLLTATRKSLEAARMEYAALDAEVMELRRAHIAATLSAKRPPQGRQSPVRTELTEMALIRAELSKQKRHIPIRQLVARAGKSIQTLKPCFMMGPLSVAQYVAPGSLKFDLVIMDEASQMRPEDAIGALARGGQAVIVGDSKQLPPTSFFDRIAESEDERDEDGTIAEDAKSILDLGEAIFDQRVLKWHYRSRHEALIAFSNKHFYKNELIVFPSPAGQSNRYGIGFTFVPEAVAKSGLNPKEARVVAEAAAKLLLSPGSRSVGVVAMNVKQAERISDELARLAKDDPALAKAMADSEGSAIGEPFFIKNLENVQGDERDVIIISMTYGPTQMGGPTPQNFGPINRDTGWRRLNVLFTRAKERMEVITSMRSSDIKPKEGTDLGPRALKMFLEYSETGRLDGAATTSGRPTGSDLEDAVLEGLRELGFDCEPQLGVANFFLDIAIRDPDVPEEFIAAVECDGAAYHSTKSARDRDRLRQEILENLGWQIRRVWSTDWFRNPQAELDRLAEELRRIIAGKRERRASGGTQHASDPNPNVSGEPETEPVRSHHPHREGELSGEQARAELIDLRERKIKAEFPDVDPARGFLRKSMLDELLRKRPTDMEEFRREIPLALREKTDAEQVKNYSQSVFDILAQMAEPVD